MCWLKTTQLWIDTWNQIRNWDAAATDMETSGDWGAACVAETEGGVNLEARAKMVR
jgi:hypothetical protein